MPTDKKFEPYKESFDRAYHANQDWKKNGIAALLLIGSPLLVTTTPLVLGTATTYKVRLAISAGDAALQLLEKGTVNPIQAITSSFGPLTYALGGSTTFDWDTRKVGIDDNASTGTIAVSTVFNVIGMNIADGLGVLNAPIPVIGLTTTITSVWGDGTNSIITGNSFIQHSDK